MAKRSRKRGAKYSQPSKTKKRKQLNRSALEPKATLTQEKKEIAEPGPKKSPIPKPAPKPKAGVGQAILDYQYVRDDLKRIGILTAGVIVILIVLAFVLG